MNFPFYIARRYLVSKKSHNIINIISGISVLGVTVGTMALIIVLSVFNGFEGVVVSLFNAFDPDLKITPVSGKTFRMSDLPEDSISRLPGVVHLTEVIEENALLRYHDRQCIATIKGMGNGYQDYSPLDTMLIEGQFVLERDSSEYAVPGAGIADLLGVDLLDPGSMISVYVPNRHSSFTGLPDESFNTGVIRPSGIFSISAEFDIKYMLTPVSFARNLFGYSEEVTSAEVSLSPQADRKLIQKQVSALAGNKFVVKNRFEQQETLYKIMKSEKWAVFLILAFILFIATFNVIGSLTMLILDKRRDIAVLRSMGASDRLVRRIFLTEGLLISLSGAVAGLVIGATVCWIQQRFGIIKLQGGSGAFIIDAYPVKMEACDFLWVFITVFLIGLAATWYPVRKIARKFSDHKL
ncbi:MAG TPA: FtsX-like permease family protein [Bacteroidales bacterium]|nr:FtsX-like permease family protein [Bacteroidales bacterium]